MGKSPNLPVQEYILQKFGPEVVQEARERLCGRCAEGRCHLLPITSDGSDCPYFWQAKEGPNGNV
jgi:hypothetical protein